MWAAVHTEKPDRSLAGKMGGDFRKLGDHRYFCHEMFWADEMGFAESVCDRVLFMDQGVVVEEGPPEVVFKNPVKDRTREFLRKHIEGAK